MTGPAAHADRQADGLCVDLTGERHRRAAGCVVRLSSTGRERRPPDPASAEAAASNASPSSSSMERCASSASDTRRYVAASALTAVSATAGTRSTARR